jgi:hypothetical protein
VVLSQLSKSFVERTIDAFGTFELSQEFGEAFQQRTLFFEYSLQCFGDIVSLYTRTTAFFDLADFGDFQSLKQTTDPTNSPTNAFAQPSSFSSRQSTSFSEFP